MDHGVHIYAYMCADLPIGIFLSIYFKGKMIKEQYPGRSDTLKSLQLRFYAFPICFSLVLPPSPSHAVGRHGNRTLLLCVFLLGFN